MRDEMDSLRRCWGGVESSEVMSLLAWANYDLTRIESPPREGYRYVSRMTYNGYDRKFYAL